MITDEMRSQMAAIQGNLSHTRSKKPGARYYRHDGNGVVEVERPSAIVGVSMFPYSSSVLPTVDLNDKEQLEQARQQCLRQGIIPEFDAEGRFIVTSTHQHDKLAKALGMKTGRDGYGHVDDQGKFHNSGRRRSDEMAEGRAKVRKAINELESMPDEVPVGMVESVLNEYDICPTEDNTG